MTMKNRTKLINHGQVKLINKKSTIMYHTLLFLFVVGVLSCTSSATKNKPSKGRFLTTKEDRDTVILAYIADANLSEDITEEDMPSVGLDTITFYKLEEDPFYQTLDYKNLKVVLQGQIENGVDPIDYYYGAPLALAALFQVEDSILANNGYKKPNDKEMRKRLKEVFGRFLSITRSSFVSIIQEGDELPDGYADNILNVDRLITESNFWYVNHKYGFLTKIHYLPEIIDYKKHFPSLLYLEKEPIYKEFVNIEDETERYELPFWTDAEGLEGKRKYNQLYLIHSNKFLFNNNRKSLEWLSNHEPDLLSRLIRAYGYVGDKQVLKLALDKCEYNQFFWSEFEGKLIFHKELLSVIDENLGSTDVDYLGKLISLLDYLGTHASSVTETSNFEEKALMAANILHFIQKKSEEEEFKTYNKTIANFYHQYGKDCGFDEEFARNDYYGLNEFGTLWEQVKK